MSATSPSAPVDPTDSKSRRNLGFSIRPDCKFQLGHWASHFTSLNPSFCIYKVGVSLSAHNSLKGTCARPCAG